MTDTVKYLLDESRIPKHWYNLQADLPTPGAAGAASRARSSRSAPTTSRRCSRWR